MSTPAAQDDWVSMKFIERYLRDRESGRVGALGDYLSLWPGHERTITGEYLALETGATEAGPGLQLGRDGLPAQVGPYEIESELGRGGQAVVYLAFDPRLRRRVALKVLRLLPGFDSTGALKRLEREAVAASRIAHPGVCAVHEVGQAEGLAYVAMQHVAGQTLAERLLAAAAGGSPAAAAARAWLADLPGVLRFFEEAARALHAAHREGVVHRDVKPGNLMIDPQGRAVVLDFGLAIELEEAGPQLTRSGELLGTPSYQAPEQVSGGRVPADARTDVWGLGVTLYETLAGRRPFDAATRADSYRRILTADPTDPRSERRDLPRDVAAIALTALEKDPDRRYGSAEAMADDLGRAARGEPVLARPAGPLRRLWQRAQRHPVAAAAVLVAFLSLALGLAAALLALGEARDAERRARELSLRNRARAEELQRIAGRMVAALFDLRLPTHIPTPLLHPLMDEVDAALDLVRESGVEDPETLALGSRAVRQRADWESIVLGSGTARIEEALEMLGGAEPAIAAGLAAHPEAHVLRREAVALAAEKAHRLRILGRTDEALAALAAVAGSVAALDRPDAPARDLRLLAAVKEAEAEAHLKGNDRDAARIPLAACLALRERILGLPGPATQDRSDLGLIALKLGRLDLNAGDREEAGVLLRRAVACAEEYQDLHPGNPLAEDRLADAWRHVAYLASAERDLPAARVAWELSALHQIAAAKADPRQAALREASVAALTKVEAAARAGGDEEHAHSARVRLATSKALGPEAGAADLRAAAAAFRDSVTSRFSADVQAWELLRKADLRAVGKDARVASDLALLADVLGLSVEAGAAAARALSLHGGRWPDGTPARLLELAPAPPDRNER